MLWGKVGQGKSRSRQKWVSKIDLSYVMSKIDLCNPGGNLIPYRKLCNPGVGQSGDVGVGVKKSRSKRGCG